MSTAQFLIAKYLFETFGFIDRLTQNEKRLREMVLSMGWELDELTGFSISELSDGLSPLTRDMKRLQPYIEKPPKNFADFKDVLSISEKLFGHFLALKETISDLDFDGPDKDRLLEFVEDALNYLVVLFLGIRFPAVYHSSVLLTLIRGEKRLEAITDASGKVIRYPKIIPKLELGRIIDLLTHPVSLLEEEYFPNGLQTDKDGTIAANKLFSRIASLLNVFGVNTVLGVNKEYNIDLGEHGAILNQDMLTAFVETDYGGQEMDYAVSLALSPASRGDLGLVVIPSGKLDLTRTFGKWLLNLKLSAGVEAFAIGRENVTILGGISNTSFDANISFMKLSESEGGSSFLWGSADGSRLEVGSFVNSIAMAYANDTFTVDIMTQAVNSALIIAPSDGDGFINSVLPKDGLNLGFDFGIGWSNQRGLYFKGFVGMEATFPIHKTILNTLTFEQLYLRFLAKDSSIQFESTLDFSAKIGPLLATVNNIGIESSLSNLGGPGNLGFADLSMDFTPPKGVGLEMKSPVMTGGGFLEFDYDNHRYSGVLALKFQSLELTAIGLINTRLPNHKKGYSMLISISVVFSPEVQLSFGFKLSGVGGLIGIHRTVKVDVLRERIRKGAVTSIMFPKNVIENAPKIISDLRAIFPPQKRHFVIAPFLKIAWGTPTIVEVDLGVLVEVPFKGRLILLGSLGIYLPSKKISKRLVELHVDVFGDFNFAESYILIEGRLRDSHVVGIKLSGGFAFVLDWGTNPQFLLSVGGYHPRYKKPARFPDVPRLTALVKRGSSISLTCKYYQAITSNSFQIGFSADLLVKKGKAQARGFLGFNALLQFDPFYFETDIKISVSVSYRGRSFFGVDLYFLLSGPKPWRAKGYAKIKILFFKLKIRFNITWGGKQKIAKPTIKPAALLDKLNLQLQDSNNWSAKLSRGFFKATTLQKIKENEKQNQIFVHPSGYLELRQNLLPLNRKLEKLGNSFIQDKPTYHFIKYEIGRGNHKLLVEAHSFKKLREYFSRGQFLELEDSDKIASADFEMMDAGILLGGNEVFDFSTEMDSTYNDFEDIILYESEIKKPKQKTFNWQEEKSMNMKSTTKSTSRDGARGAYGMVDELPDLEDELEFQ